MTAPTRPRRPAPPQPGVVPTAGRVAARARAEAVGRRRQRARFGARIALIGVAVLVPVLAAGYVLLLSPWLAVEQVEVTGTQRLTPEQVVEAAAVEPQTPLARLDAGAVAERVRTLPPVKSVHVRRGWPSTLELQVVERQAVAVLAGPDGVRLLDDDGVPFATEPAAPAGLPAIDVASPGPEDAATRAALDVLASLPPELAEAVGVVRARSADDVELHLRDGRTVMWGSADDVETKVAAAQVLLRMPGTVFDVSAPGVVVRK